MLRNSKLPLQTTSRSIYGVTLTRRHAEFGLCLPSADQSCHEFDRQTWPNPFQTWPTSARLRPRLVNSRPHCVLGVFESLPRISRSSSIALTATFGRCCPKVASQLCAAFAHRVQVGTNIGQMNGMSSGSSFRVISESVSADQCGGVFREEFPSTSTMPPPTTATTQSFFCCPSRPLANPTHQRLPPTKAHAQQHGQV